MGVNAMGFSIEEMKPEALGNRKRADFVTKEGNLLPNLPVDSHHIRIWEKNGFRLATDADRKSPIDPLVCSICGEGPFKAKIGLTGHMRTHT